jgi:hypothetical protein
VGAGHRLFEALQLLLGPGAREGLAVLAQRLLHGLGQDGVVGREPSLAVGEETTDGALAQIEIDDGDLRAAVQQGRRQVDGDSGLARPAFSLPMTMTEAVMHAPLKTAWKIAPAHAWRQC